MCWDFMHFWSCKKTAPLPSRFVFNRNNRIFILEWSIPSTLVYPGTTEGALLRMQSLKTDEQEPKTSFHCAVACAYVCLCGGAAPHLRGFFGVCLTTKHKPFCVGERGRPPPKLQRWALFDSCFHLVIIPPSHSRIFGLPKVFLSFSPSSPSFVSPQSFSLSVTGLWLAVMTEPSPGCQPLLKLSLITPFH